MDELRALGGLDPEKFTEDSYRRSGLALGLILTWGTWQVLLSLGLLPFDATGLLSTAVHLTFAVIAVSSFGLRSHEVASDQRVPRSLMRIIGIGLSLCLFFSVVISMNAGASIIAGLGLTLLGLFVFMTLGAPVALTGGIVFGSGWIATHTGGGENPLGGSSILQGVWSLQGVFGPGLQVSTQYLFIFTAFGGFIASSPILATLLAWRIKGKAGAMRPGASLVSALMRGALSGSSSAALAVGHADRRQTPLPDPNHTLDPCEQGALLTVATSFSQVMPPVLTASGFLISYSLDVPFIDVLFALLVPGLLVAGALLYFCSAAASRSREGTTFTEVLRFLSSVIRFLSMAAVGACAFYFVVRFGAGLRFDEKDAVIWVVGLLVVQVLSNALSRGAYSTSKSQSMITRFGESEWPVLMTFLVLLVGLPERPEFAAGICLVYGLTLRAAVLTLRSSAPGAVSTAVLELVEREFMRAALLTGLLAIALAFVGLVVSPVTLMGWGPVLTDWFSDLTLGRLAPALLVTGVLTVFLGLAFTTTASYLLTSMVMVPILAVIGSETAVFPSLISLHIFVLYFAACADFTPPDDVAVEAISRQWSLPKSQIQRHCIKFAFPLLVLPFAFVGRDVLFLVTGSQLAETVGAVVVVAAGIILLIHVAVGHLFRSLTRARTILLLLIAFTLLLPPEVLRSIVTHDRLYRENLSVVLLQPAPQSTTVELSFTDPLSEGMSEYRLPLTVIKGGTVADALREAGLALWMSPEESLFVEDADEFSLLDGHGVNVGMELKSLRSPEALFNFRLLYLISSVLLILFIYLTKRGAARTSSDSL